MSQAGIAGSGGGGAGFVNSITGDTGTTVSGAVLLYANHGSASAGSTVGFNGSSATELDLVVTDSSQNTIIGKSAGNSSISSSGANGNTGFGYAVLSQLTVGSGNVCIGNGTGAFLTTGTFMGGGNTFIGSNTGTLITTGVDSILIGNGTGGNYNSSESYNILIGSALLGTLGESNVMRLGNPINISSCYIAGIKNVTVSNQAQVVINTSTGQLGTTVQGLAGATTTFGNTAAPTGTTSTAAYVMLGLGSSWNITPATYTSVRVHINGQLTNGTTGDGINIIIAYGTGTAPINGAGVSGTAIGINTIFTDLTGLLTNGVPFAKEYIITGLTVGTPYWFDLQFKAITGGTASLKNLEFVAQELQY